MQHFQNIIDNIAQKGLSRQLTAISSLEAGYCEFKGERLVNLSSNDYLGLADDLNLKSEFAALLAQHPEWMQMGACSSRLLTGNSALYDETEALLKSRYGSQAALFFNSGYHANVGILPALTDKGDLILSDKLCHASMIDGIRLSSADHVRYRHLDYVQLENFLSKKRQQYRHVFIVTESVFSMDGDEADLRMLCDLKEQYDAFLYVDEAHSVGVKGINGLGTCEEQGVTQRIDILVGTLGKAFASVGAFGVFSQTLKEVLVNKSRTLLFTTALPPVNMAWSKFIIERMPGFTKEREQLKKLSEQLSHDLTEAGFSTRASHILPVMVGENEAAVRLANHLRREGFLVFAIRPPTVPENTARLRLSLTANLNPKPIKKMVELISEYFIK